MVAMVPGIATVEAAGLVAAAPVVADTTPHHRPVAGDVGRRAYRFDRAFLLLVFGWLV